MEKKRALILGASGVVGKNLLARLLKDERYEQVVALVRTKLDVNHPKLFQVPIDFEKLRDYKDNFAVHHVYCCLGTTLKKARTKSAFKRCDYYYVVWAAEMAKEKGVEHFVVISSLGANSSSPFFYTQIKGQMEKDVYEMGPSQVSFIRPSFLDSLPGERERDDQRPIERAMIKLLRPIKPLFIGQLKKYVPVLPSDVAKIMHQKAFNEKIATNVEHYTLVKR